MCSKFQTAKWGVTCTSSFVPRPRQYFPTSAEDLTMKARFFQIVFNDYTPCSLFFSLKSWNCSWKNSETERKKKCRRLPPPAQTDMWWPRTFCCYAHHATWPGAHDCSQIKLKICFLLCAGMQEYQELWLVSSRWFREVGVFYESVRYFSHHKMRNWSTWIAVIMRDFFKV